MKAIMVMFDSLNRHYLPNYGCDWTNLPNFKRLGEHTVTFENSYIGSMPCMPARREMHTGRYNFLHRSWGPLEPFDDSMPEILSAHGVYTHLISDHQHYWEDGGATYHHRYNTWEIVRGQEGDRWKGQVNDPPIPPHYGQFWRQDAVNRQYLDTEEKQPQTQTFQLGMEFIEKNKDADQWFLQIECFDPHEPFYTMPHYQQLYPHTHDGVHFDWPEYKPLEQSEHSWLEHIRCQYAALLSMCDKNLGRILDMMDRYDMWKDTMLIVNTDHGFLLGEHDWWAKSGMPYYNEIARTPLFIWDPRCGCKGVRRNSLAQMIDIPPTLLEYFGADIPADMQGKSLRETIADDQPARENIMFGIFGGYACCTDGRYVYMRASNPQNSPLYEYTLMPTHMRMRFSPDELQDIQLSEPFSFTKGCRTMKLSCDSAPMKGKGDTFKNISKFGNLLFDLKNDPNQQHPIDDPQLEGKMIDCLVHLMQENDAPIEQYQRLNLTGEK